MKLLIVENKTNPEILFFKKVLGENCEIIIKNNKENNYLEKQKNFDAIYTTNPLNLLDLKISIPYFYNIPSGLFNNELDFNVFHNFYSKIKGASGVFVSDKKLHKYSLWSDLNAYWIANAGIIPYPKIPNLKNYLSSKLKIGYIYSGNEEDFKIIEETILMGKNNWEFYVNLQSYRSNLFNNLKKYNNKIYFFSSNEEIYDKVHILIEFYTPKNNRAIPFPTHNTLQSIGYGCVPLVSNISNNWDYVFFDKTHYLKLDYTDSNTIISALRYIDRRRKKIETINFLAKKQLYKYFSLDKIIEEKIEIIRQNI